MRLNLKVQTGSAREELCKQADGSWKAYVHSRPEKGQANADLLSLLSRQFGVAKSQIKIVSGLSTKKKIIEIGGDDQWARSA
jgi:uncharacterized protein (TIGR00251 family)